MNASAAIWAICWLLLAAIAGMGFLLWVSRAQVHALRFENEELEQVNRGLQKKIVSQHLKGGRS